LGYNYKKIGVLKKAAQIFENVYELSKTYNESIAFYSIIEAYFLYSKLDDKENAFNCFEKSKKIFPRYEYFDHYFKMISKNII